MATTRYLFLLALVAGCGVAETAAPPVAAPPPAEELLADALPAEPEPEPTLQERRGRPFAVLSRGAVEPRPPRSVVVIRPTPAPTPEPAAAPVAAADTAAETPVRMASTGASTGATAAPPADAPARPAAAAATAADADDDDDDAADAVAAARREALEAIRAAARAGRAEREARVERDAAPARERPAAAAPEPAAEPSRADAESPRTHTVAYGETWLGIALRYGISWRELAEANPGVDPERLVSGRRLRIPGGEAREEPASAARNGDADEPRRHTVRAGDSLWIIARRYEVSMETIRQANDLDDDRVRIGQVLVIPGAEAGR